MGFNSVFKGLIFTANGNIIFGGKKERVSLTLNCQNFTDVTVRFLFESSLLLDINTAWIGL
jgi:hypothetical protein